MKTSEQFKFTIEQDIIKMKALVKLAHGDQTYGEIRPYTDHLEHAEQVAKRFGFCERGIMLAVIGHDLIEDTDVFASDLAEIFGESIRFIDTIENVSDRFGETKEDTVKRIVPCLDSIVVKLCDRVANIEACLAEGKSYGTPLEKYAKEHKFFFNFLDHPAFKDYDAGKVYQK